MVCSTNCNLIRGRHNPDSCNFSTYHSFVPYTTSLWDVETNGYHIWPAASDVTSLFSPFRRFDYSAFASDISGDSNAYLIVPTKKFCLSLSLRLPCLTLLGHMTPFGIISGSIASAGLVVLAWREMIMKPRLIEGSRSCLWLWSRPCVP